MKTCEIVKALPKDKLVSQILPLWAIPTIPYPFYRNGMQCLGFYYYPMVKKDGEKRIQAPIIQIVTTYPEGNIISIVASPYFLSDPKNSTLLIGTYPSKKIRELPFDKCNGLYQDYYSACDAFFDNKEVNRWQNLFSELCEEGMEDFFSLFSLKPSIHVIDKKVEAFAVPQDKQTTSFDMISLKSKHFLRELKDFYSHKIFSQEASELQNIMNDINREEFTIAMIGDFSSRFIVLSL